MNKGSVIEHIGIVKALNTDFIDVTIESVSACSACHAKGACGMSDTKEKVIRVQTTNKEIKIGDKVMIVASTSVAYFSVIIAYVLPSVFLIMLLYFFNEYKVSDLISGSVSLMFVGIYFMILYLLRGKLARKINFTLKD